MGYTRTAIKGISWMTGLQSTFRIFTFAKIFILARLLTPAQFGIFGIAALVLALLEILTETGINVILIQSRRQIEEYLDSAWVVSIVRGVIIALGIILLAPLIVSFFSSPDALGILLLISIAPFIKGFINPAEVIYQKELKFKNEFWFRSTLYFIDAIVAIIAAFITHSVYSLAFGLIAAAVTEVIVSFIFISPRPKFKFEKKYVNEIYHLGKWVTGYSIFNYFGENGDNIIVGKLLGASSLGIYQMAYRIAILPITEISDVINKVIFPVYSKIQHDKKRLFSAFIKTSLFASIGTVGFGLIIFIFSGDIVRIFLGSQWSGVIGPLKILVIYASLKSIFSSVSVVFLSTSKQKYQTIITTVRMITLFIIIIPLVYQYGLVGAGYAQASSILAEIPFMFYLLSKIL